MGRKPFGQLFGNLSLECLFGQRTVITGMAMESHLVFHLYHDDGLVEFIHFLQVAHHGGKGFGVGLAGLISQGSQYGKQLALGRLCQREALRIFLHPQRSITCDAVFP